MLLNTFKLELQVIAFHVTVKHHSCMATEKTHPRHRSRIKLINALPLWAKVIFLVLGGICFLYSIAHWSGDHSAALDLQPLAPRFQTDPPRTFTAGCVLHETNCVPKGPVPVVLSPIRTLHPFWGNLPGGRSSDNNAEIRGLPRPERSVIDLAIMHK